MKPNTPEKLDGVIAAIEKLGAIIEQIVDAMPKPPNKLERILNGFLTFVGILGIVAIADIIIKWITGV